MRRSKSEKNKDTEWIATSSLTTISFSFESLENKGDAKRNEENTRQLIDFQISGLKLQDYQNHKRL